MTSTCTAFIERELSELSDGYISPRNIPVYFTAKESYAVVCYFYLLCLFVILERRNLPSSRAFFLLSLSFGIRRKRYISVSSLSDIVKVEHRKK